MSPRTTAPAEIAQFQPDAPARTSAPHAHWHGTDHAKSSRGARPVRRVDLAVFGASGRVGRRVLELIAQRRADLVARGLHLEIVAAANSRSAILADDGLEPSLVAGRLLAAPSATADALARSLEGVRSRPLVVLDCTASADVSARYPLWLAAGIDVVTPNKLGPSADRPLASAIAAARSASDAMLYDGTTVGAQLPLLAPLRELHAAGDRIVRLEAVLSGTLSFVLAQLHQGAALSVALHDAIALGYAEPHPGRDLSGEDAARKLVILLRAFGHDLELNDVERVALIDAALLEHTDVPDFLTRLPQADETWRARVAVAQVCRERWVYRASFVDGHARVAPERVPVEHPLARLAPCENALILHSDYYGSAPLTIAGPGAGIDLTAAGVYADLLTAARRYICERGGTTGAHAACLATVAA